MAEIALYQFFKLDLIDHQASLIHPSFFLILVFCLYFVMFEFDFYSLLPLFFVFFVDPNIVQSTIFEEE